MNPYAIFKELLRTPQLQIGTVTAVATGSVEVQLPSGGKIHARGAATVGQQVFVRDGAIEGTAPTMTTYDIDV